MAPTTIHREAVLQIGPCNDFSILYGGMWEETFLPTHFIHSSYSSSLDKYGLDGGNDISFTNPVENIISRQGETEMLSLRGFFEHVLGEELGITKPFNDVSCLLIVPPSFSRTVRNAIMKSLLCNFGDIVPPLVGGGLFLADSPVMAAYGVGVTNALVIDMNHNYYGSVSLVIDAEVQLPNNVNSISFADKDELYAALQFIIRNCEQEKRSSILSNLIINPPSEQGEVLSLLEGLICSSDFPNEMQPRSLMLKQVPSHFSIDEVEIKKASQYTSWFGGGITAKCTLSDYKHLIRKSDL